MIRNKELAHLYKLVYKRPNCGVEDVFLTAVLIMNKVEVEVAELYGRIHVELSTVRTGTASPPKLRRTWPLTRWELSARGSTLLLTRAPRRIWGVCRRL